MTALGIRYLMGFAVSSDTTRQKPEFPPHPGRVFMAMAAAHFHTQGGVEERRALEWLQSQSEAPHLQVPEFAYRRSSQTRVPLETYVPVNDTHGGILQRSRQPRSFPTARLFDDKVYLVWNSDAPAEIRHALEALCAKVTRIGHSSSLVQMWLLDKEEQVQPTLIADNQLSDRKLRVAGSGTLEYLEQSFSAGRYPRLDVWSGYRLAVKEAPRPTPGPFDSNIIVLQKLEGRSLGLESTLQLTSALRNAAMKALPQGECPEWLSGHQADGTPTREPHAAFFPLPFVDAPWADGHIVGLAIAVPSGIGAEEVKRVLGRLLFNPDSGGEREIILWRNDAWWWRMSREMRDRPPMSLQIRTWTQSSREWRSVTPVVLHHYPKKNREQDIERILFEAFESAQLPRPKAISALPVSPLAGVGHARSVPEFTEGGEALCRYQTHVVAEFDEPVQGPVLVGRGRFRGYGLFRPVKSEALSNE
jgi:CRISPR-associated protein Csb2